MVSSSTDLPDILNPCSQVRRSCKTVYDHMLKQASPNVKINDIKITEFISSLEAKVKSDGVAFDPWANYHIDPNQYPLEQVLAYTFVVDAMNFCFWPGNPAGNFEYEHMTKNLAKVLDSQSEWFKAEKMS